MAEEPYGGRLFLLHHKGVLGQFTPESVPSVFTPDNVEAIRVQLHTLDQQPHEAVLLHREHLRLDVTDTAHGHHDHGFIESGLLLHCQHFAPHADDHLGFLQHAQDLHQHS